MNEMLESMLREVQSLSEKEQERIAHLLEEEVRRARREPQMPSGRWARFVERIQREAPMAGQSETFLSSVRDFREHFDTRGKPAEG